MTEQQTANISSHERAEGSGHNMNAQDQNKQQEIITSIHAQSWCMNMEQQYMVASTTAKGTTS